MKNYLADWNRGEFDVCGFMEVGSETRPEKRTCERKVEWERNKGENCLHTNWMFGGQWETASDIYEPDGKNNNHSCKSVLYLLPLQWNPNKG